MKRMEISGSDHSMLACVDMEAGHYEHCYFGYDNVMMIVLSLMFVLFCFDGKCSISW